MVFANVRKLVKIVLPFDHFHRQALLVRSVCMFCFNLERGIQSLCVRVPGVLWPHLAPRNTDARDESKDERRTQDTGRWRPIAGWLCLYSRSNSLSCGDNWPNGFLLRSEMSHKLKDFAELAAPSLYRRVRTTHDSAIFRAAFRSAVSENR